jgi:hypothetical protein
MFTAKQPPAGVKTSASPFVKTALKSAAMTLSGKGALKYSTTGNDFVDQFAKTGLYKIPRPFDSIATDMSTLWAKNPLMTVVFTLFLRCITRVVTLFDGNKTSVPQRGSGLRHESIMRMIWIYIFHQQTFWKNINLFISVGSWKDVIQMMSYDYQYNTWKGRVLDWEKFGKLILAGLENPQHSHLILKYLPQFKANSTCRTIEAQADNAIAKYICSLLFGPKESSGNYRLYRKLKTSGKAHQWQQLISQGKHDLVDFDSIHGRALSLIVSGKYIERQGLEAKYEAWISSKPVAKFTGYVHELFKRLPSKKYQIDTLNKQFEMLVETAKKGAVTSTGLIVVRDTSGSMSGTASATGMSCYDIGKALALFFSKMLPHGKFADAWIEFNSDAKLHVWKGSTPFEQWSNDHSGFVGSTKFMSVIKLLCRIKAEGISEEEFPSGILCISDCEFDPSDLGTTNVDAARHMLSSAGFTEEYVKNFKIVLWNLQSNYHGPTTGQKFETYGDVENVYYFGGYDGSIIAFLTGVKGQEKDPKTPEELFKAAMDQEVLRMVEI